MNKTTADHLQEKVYGLTMFLASLLLMASSAAYWLGNGPRLDGLGGTMQIYAIFCFIFVVLGLTNLLWQRTPGWAVVLRILGIFGCVGGINYGMISVYGQVVTELGASETLISGLVQASDSSLPLVLNLPGLLFPLTMLMLGITLWRSGSAPAWVGGMLALAGVMFPASRIPNIPALFFIADALFLVSLGWIGLQYLYSPRQQTVVSQQVA